MPLLPLKALRRGSHDQAENAGRRRVTRGVTLLSAVDDHSSFEVPQATDMGKTLIQSRSFSPRAQAQPANALLGAGAQQGARSPRTSASPIPGSLAEATGVLSAAATPPLTVATPTRRGASPVMRTPARPRVSFARSPCNTSTDVTPYARVYGVHPAFFDFDQNGAMQPTPAGLYEMQRGALPGMTPTSKGRMALVIQGSGSPASSSGMSSPVCGASPMACWPPTPAARFPQLEMKFSAGEQVLVLTDDGKKWMEGNILATFSVDTEAEGYSIPAGTVKVSYELGIKWVMPQNMGTTLRKKIPAATFSNFAPPQRPMTYTGISQPQLPQAGAASWQVFPGHMPFMGRAA